jgi:hypothetical protein
MSERMGLFDLVAAARRHYTGRARVSGWLGEPDEILSGLEEHLDTIVCAAANGNFLQVARLARWWEQGLHDSLSIAFRMFLDWITQAGYSIDLSDAPAWGCFADACNLAERIDSLLATLESGPGSGLARGCRDDLDGLAVLADWCDDQGLAASAREARHLHGLVRDVRATLQGAPMTLDVTVHLDADDSEME